MADIAQDLANIKSAVYGEEVRGSIHDAIRDINNEVISSNTKSDNAVSTANTAAQSASASAASAAQTAAQNASAVQAAQTAAEAARDAAQTAKTQAETAKTQAETARSQASTYAGNASTSAQNAANSATTAQEAASRAESIVIGDIYANTIKMSETDQTKVSEAISNINIKVDSANITISFTNLSFTASGTKYVAMISHSAITANHKPGNLTMVNPAAIASSLDIETFAGYLTFTMTAQPTVAFSGELLLHRIAG